MAFELTLCCLLSIMFPLLEKSSGNPLAPVIRVGEHIASRKGLGVDGPNHRLDGTWFVRSRRRLRLVA